MCCAGAGAVETFKPAVLIARGGRRESKREVCYVLWFVVLMSSWLMSLTPPSSPIWNGKRVCKWRPDAYFLLKVCE